MKYVKYTLLVLLLLIVAAVAGTWFYLDTIVKKAVNKYGSQIVGTEVNLTEFSINPFKGVLKIGGLTVGNPNGYSAPALLTLGGINVTVDPKSVFSDTIIVKDVTIDNPTITYEMPDFSTSNVMQIQENVSKNTASEPKAEDTKEEKTEETASSKNVVIKKVTVAGGMLSAITPLQKHATALDINLPAVELVDLGGENQKLTIKDSIVEILNKILFNATSTVTKVLGSAKDMAKKAAGAALDSATNVADEAKGKTEGFLESLKFW